MADDNGISFTQHTQVGVAKGGFLSNLSHFQKLLIAGGAYVAATIAMVLLYQSALGEHPTWGAFWFVQCLGFAFLSVLVTVASQRADPTSTIKSPPILGIFVVSAGMVVSFLAFAIEEWYSLDQAKGAASAGCIMNEPNLMRAIFDSIFASLFGAQAAADCASGETPAYLISIFLMLGLSVIIALTISAMLAGALHLKKTGDTPVPPVELPGTDMEQAELASRIEQKAAALKLLSDAREQVVGLTDQVKQNDDWLAYLMSAKDDLTVFEGRFKARQGQVASLNGFAAAAQAGTLGAAMAAGQALFAAVVNRISGTPDSPLNAIGQAIATATGLLAGAKSDLKTMLDGLSETLRNTHKQTVGRLSSVADMDVLVDRLNGERSELDRALALLKATGKKSVTPRVLPQSRIQVDEATLDLGADAHGIYRLTRELKRPNILPWIVAATAFFLVTNNLLLAPPLDTTAHLDLKAGHLALLVLIGLTQVATGTFALMNIQNDIDVYGRPRIPAWLAFAAGIVPTALAAGIAGLVLLFWPSDETVITYTSRPLKELTLSCPQSKWTYGESTQIDTIATELSTCLPGEQLDEKTTTLVVVGLASQEGSTHDQIKLAQQRADVLSAMLLEDWKGGGEKSVYTVNLGQSAKAPADGSTYDKPYTSPSLATGWQRPVIVLTGTVETETTTRHPAKPYSAFIANIFAWKKLDVTNKSTVAQKTPLSTQLAKALDSVSVTRDLKFDKAKYTYCEARSNTDPKTAATLCPLK